MDVVSRYFVAVPSAAWVVLSGLSNLLTEMLI